MRSRGKAQHDPEQTGLEKWLLLLVLIVAAPVVYDCFGQSRSAYRFGRTGFNWTEYFTVRLPLSAAIFGTIAFILWFTRKRDS